MSDANEAPLPKNKINIPDLTKDGFTICTQCLSAIEIINIKEENNIIEYRCIKEDKVFIMELKEYLKKDR